MEPLATLTHDLQGGGTLYAYPAEPAAQNRQIDQVHERMYGFRTLSPRTPYICVWRDPARFRATAADGPPVRILMACSFGADDWSPPLDLLKEAEQRMFRQEGLLRLDWASDDTNYRLTRVELEVRGPHLAKNFRSANGEGDLAELQVRDWAVSFPQSVEDGLSFRIEVAAPYRLNSGEPAKAPTATLRMHGTALPIPDWLMY